MCWFAVNSLLIIIKSKFNHFVCYRVTGPFQVNCLHYIFMRAHVQWVHAYSLSTRAHLYYADNEAHIWMTFFFLNFDFGIFNFWMKRISVHSNKIIAKLLFLIHRSIECFRFHLIEPIDAVSYTLQLKSYSPIGKQLTYQNVRRTFESSRLFARLTLNISHKNYESPHIFGAPSKMENLLDRSINRTVTKCLCSFFFPAWTTELVHFLLFVEFALSQFRKLWLMLVANKFAFILKLLNWMKQIKFWWFVCHH